MADFRDDAMFEDEERPAAKDITRDLLATHVARVIGAAWVGAKVDSSVTTSGCPLIKISFPDGDAFHLTVTRARA